MTQVKSRMTIPEYHQNPRHCQRFVSVSVSSLCSGRFRAVNNELLDTYQLKSLDGLVEAGLERITIVQQHKRSRRRSGGGGGQEKKGQLYVTLNKYLEDEAQKNSSDVTAADLPGYHIDNFSMRKPYDRVIRCLGFRFNFSIFDRYEFRGAAEDTLKQTSPADQE